MVLSFFPSSLPCPNYDGVTENIYFPFYGSLFSLVNYVGLDGVLAILMMIVASAIIYSSPLLYSAVEPIRDSVNSYPSEQTPEISLWERLGKAAMLDIESSEFSWHSLSSLHHTEHSSGAEYSEDEMNKAVEVGDIFLSCVMMICVLM